MWQRRHPITEHIPRLRRFARALTGDAARADDLVQDTLERALKKFALWRHGSDLRAWLFTVMHNVYVNQQAARREGAGPAWEGVSDEDVLEKLPVAPTQEKALELRDLAAALAQLAPEQREVLLLVGLEGLRYEEVARVLGVPLGTVMSRLARGRERLRRLMEGERWPSLRRVK
ncbi:sigma-70 family RNA polymerase sigma factor [Thiobacter aerophilum]|uniref:Sigma-70 family RNA polymerase sigma factor n=1 Tax=Thiobacter aerophilum TaxID=3121275 RepID=A0ABV0ED66_9BURK